MSRDPAPRKARDPNTGPITLADDALHGVSGGLSTTFASELLLDADAALTSAFRGRYQLRLDESRKLLAK